MRAYSCDAFTGEVIDRLPMKDCSWSRLLSAGGEGSLTVPLDGTWTQVQLSSLVDEWRRIIVLERDGVPEYGGFVLGHGYTLEGSALTLKLKDAWTLFGRRGAWDRAHPYTPQWSASVTGTRGFQAWAAVNRGRNTGAVLDKTRFPVSLVASGGGASVTRKYFGYHLEMISDVHAALLEEGLDIYMRPRWVSGRFDWGFYAGPSWESGTIREFAPTAADPKVANLTESVEADRVTNNAARIGEGSEVDMLGRSRQNFASPYPVLDRVTASKTVSDVTQLEQQALSDLATFGEPTRQWDFDVLASEQIDVGDTVHLHISGDPVIADGRHTRRVVKVSGGLSDFVSIGVQPVGGA